jgi:glyoxylase-like metal-dependent hydrolase (beta-lactamase superfamily II)
MALPDHVHALPLTTTIQGRERTFTPAAVETESGLLLFDVGLPGTLDLLEAELEAADFGLSDVEGVLLTHQDGDHCGALAELREATDPFVVAHEPTARIVDGREDPRSGPDRYPPARVDCAFDGSVTFDTLAGPAHVFPTPGHTPDHVSVHFPEARFLLAGDALTADEDGLQSPNEGFTEDWDRALESVAALAELDVESTLCFHGGFVEAGRDRIAEIGETGE